MPEPQRVFLLALRLDLYTVAYHSRTSQRRRALHQGIRATAPEVYDRGCDQSKEGHEDGMGI
jgi:hypothetical protein